MASVGNGNPINWEKFICDANSSNRAELSDREHESRSN